MHLPKILLLDCSDEITTKLMGLGFNISTGSAGYATGTKKLPHQLYECEVIIYNPRQQVTDHYNRPLNSYTMEDGTPQFPMRFARNFLEQGGIIVTFVNQATTLSGGRTPYEWIPDMPDIHETHDEQVFNQRNEGFVTLLRPMLTIEEVKRPVRQTLHPRQASRFSRAEALFRNRNNDILGVVYTGEKSGMVIVLPEFNDNDEVVIDFFLRVYPHFIPESRADVVSAFVSPAEEKGKTRLKKVTDSLEKMRKAQETVAMATTKASRAKKNKILKDDTAKRLIIYLQTAQENPNHALFYLAKVTELLELKYGAESAAKKVLGHSEEWNRINKLANASYADNRHAAKPGETIKKPSAKDVAQCFEDTMKIMHAYFKTLFQRMGAKKVK